MYDPENPKEKREFSPPPPPSVATMELLSQKAKLRFYITDGGMAEAYGFKLVNKKLVIENLDRINRFDGDTKAILRELYLELK